VRDLPVGICPDELYEGRVLVSSRIKEVNHLPNWSVLLVSPAKKCVSFLAERNSRRLVFRSQLLLTILLFCFAPFFNLTFVALRRAVVFNHAVMISPALCVFLQRC
jgi:hypothetical protein